MVEVADVKRFTIIRLSLVPAIRQLVPFRLERIVLPVLVRARVDPRRHFALDVLEVVPAIHHPKTATENGMTVRRPIVS